jgi:hypothetical protein
VKFRKRPVVVEAVRYRGDNVSEVRDFIGAEVEELAMSPPIFVIQTLEGRMRAHVGDWIIRGVKGELYPCKPDIFALTYEPTDL